MPCPYFSPDQPLAETGWFLPPRAPLGLLHGGECSCGPAPKDLDLCNFGYARGVCENFPADAPFDAVRFAVAAQTEHTTELIYILERACAPAEQGRITYDIRANQIRDKEEPLTAQARAFVAAGRGN